MQTIIKTAGGSSNIESADVDDKFELLLEINDQLLDQAVSIANLYNNLCILSDNLSFSINFSTVEYING